MDGDIFSKTSDARASWDASARDEEHSLNDYIVYLDELTIPAWDGTIGTSFAGGSGEETNPYIIENGEQLAYFAKTVNEGETFEGKYILIKQSINLGMREFTPIGGGTTEIFLEGTLEGNNNTITGININLEDTNFVALIGIVGQNGTVRNLRLGNGEIIGSSNVGGLVGRNRGTIVNCDNKVSVTAKNGSAGGIAATATGGSITNCTNSGKIVSEVGTAGGISAMPFECKIISCTNYGEVKAEGNYAGGIVAFSGSKISDCTNNGKIIAENYCGGITGDAGTKDISNCQNNGEIFAQYISGGITSNMQGGTISRCTNRGKVLASNNIAGGISGTIKNGTITQCTNTGEITSLTSHSGGIAGYVRDGNVTGCNNTGEIVANKRYAGGTVGRITGGNVSNCSNSGNVKSNADGTDGMAGGIIGYLDSELSIISNVYNTGNVTTVNSTSTIDSAGGIVGRINNGKVENAYNKGNIEGEAIGGVCGIKNTGEIEKAYYYTENSALKGIGSSSSDEIVAVNDVNGMIEKTTEIHNSLEAFLSWLRN